MLERFSKALDETAAWVTEQKIAEVA